MSYSFNSPALRGNRQVRPEDIYEFLPLVKVDLSDLEDKVRESSADTLNGLKGEHGLALTVDVCVLDSENVSELFSLDQVE